MDIIRKNRLKANLALDDGTIFRGFGLGFPSRKVGEVVFNTGMVGYTESLTDPSYCGQILCFTYPLIGNYGVPNPSLKDNYGLPIGFESDNLQISGVIMHELCNTPEHWASIMSLDEWLKNGEVPGICGIDTRELTKKIRTHGVMMGVLDVSEEMLTDNELLNLIKKSQNYEEINFIENVSVKEPILYGNGENVVVLIDCGVKINIIRELLRRDCKVIRVPYNMSSKDILKYNPKGVIVSNGPGNPKLCTRTVKTVQELFETNVPMLGICLGTQIIALALGGNTFKLKYGHRGQNKPCLDMLSGKGYVTSQNHGYSVDIDSLDNTGLRPWFINADDKTCEGLIHENGKCISVQFHPEASPGPYDTEYVFDEFIRIMM
ncbi:MAG TPA: glutamine-hydrolyzing carbamoyl-phosphate synthase small subunit [Nitrososphaerales archaeon]